jgi:hypothetical protein
MVVEKVVWMVAMKALIMEKWLVESMVGLWVHC